MEQSAEYVAASNKHKETKAAAVAGPPSAARRTAGMASSRRSSSCRTEKVLCGSLNLSPMRYVIVKTILIKDHLQKRQGIPSKSRLPGYLDKVLKKRILNFLTESGWISRDAS